MDGSEKYEDYSCVYSLIACLLLSFIYVSSLYVWNSPHNRNHPATIKKRFFSVFVMTFISPIFLYYYSQESVLKNATIWQLLGLRLRGFIQALILPLLLTMVLYLGPLCMQGLDGLRRLCFEHMHWYSSEQFLIWIRNLVVAPLSEEFTFRASMLPLLLQCFRPYSAIFISPLFFGIAHFHHMLERMRDGVPFQSAFLISSFQFLYTFLFGAYSAFLFARTGHFIAPFIVHSFCNYMGLPEFTEVLALKNPQRIFYASLYVVGLVSWCFLLIPVTNPSWYSNDLWKRHWH